MTAPLPSSTTDSDVRGPLSTGCAPQFWICPWRLPVVGPYHGSPAAGAPCGVGGDRSVLFGPARAAGPRQSKFPSLPAAAPGERTHRNERRRLHDAVCGVDRRRHAELQVHGLRQEGQAGRRAPGGKEAVLPAARVVRVPRAAPDRLQRAPEIRRPNACRPSAACRCRG